MTKNMERVVECKIDILAASVAGYLEKASRKVITGDLFQEDAEKFVTEVEEACGKLRDMMFDNHFDMVELDQNNYRLREIERCADRGISVLLDLEEVQHG